MLPRALRVKQRHANAVVVAQRCGGGQPIGLAGFEVELEQAVGHAIGKHHAGVLRGAQHAGGGQHLQRRAELVVGARGGVVGVALHAQCVVAGAQGPGRAAVIGQLGADVGAAGVQNLKVLGRAAAGEVAHRHLARLAKVEAEILRGLVGLQKLAAKHLARHDGLRPARHGGQLEAQHAVTQHARRGGVAGHGQQVVAATRHAQLGELGAARVALGEQHAAGVIKAEHAARAGAGQAAQVGVHVGVQRDVEQSQALAWRQVHRHRRVGCQVAGHRCRAEGEAGRARALRQRQRVLARRQPAHRCQPGARDVGAERFAKHAVHLDAAGAGQQPALPVAGLPVHHHPAVGRHSEREAGIGGRARHALSQRDGLAGHSGRWRGRRSDERQGGIGLAVVRHALQQQGDGACGLALVENSVAQRAGQQRTAIGVKRPQAEVFGHLGVGSRKGVTRRSGGAPQAQLTHGHARQRRRHRRCVDAGERQRVDRQRAASQTGAAQLQPVVAGGQGPHLGGRRLRAQRRPVEQRAQRADQAPLRTAEGLGGAQHKCVARGHGQIKRQHLASAHHGARQHRGGVGAQCLGRGQRIKPMAQLQLAPLQAA